MSVCEEHPRWEVGQQVDRGSELFGPAMLVGMGIGTHDTTGAFSKPSQPLQKTLSLPPHLTRPLDAIDFAHPTERELARVFSYFQVNWIYEPTTFHLEVDEAGRPTEQVCPDFYLPDHDIYVELTTMRQSLVTRKNRKIRRLKEAFPSLHIKMLYRKDYDRLMGSVFGSNGHAVAPVPGKPLVNERQLEQRISALANEIAAAPLDDRRIAPCWGRAPFVETSRASSDWPDDCDGELTLIGLGNEAIPFLTALEFDLQFCGLSTAVDVMTLTRPAQRTDGDRVRIARRPAMPLDGRDIVLVTGIISTGLNVAFAVDWLGRQGARSVRICTLFDRTDARILDVPVSWSAFRAPHDIVVGFGIGYQNQYHDLPVVAPLKAPARPRNRGLKSDGATESL